MRVRDETKEVRLLEAALTLFSRDGYRSTSVARIAAHAGVAKGTVYLYYENKEALFQGVCQTIATTFLTRARAAAIAPDLLTRLLGVLTAKYAYLSPRVYHSPFGAELIETKNELCREIFTRADGAYHELLRAQLLDPSLALEPLGLDPQSAADLLMRVAYSLARSRPAPAEDYAAELEVVLRTLLHGLQRT